MLGIAVVYADVAYYREFAIAGSVAVDIVVFVVVHGCHVEIEQVGIAILYGMGYARCAVVLATTAHQKS